MGFFLKNIQFLKNFSYLALFELVNLLFPLAITPYIIKKIGFESYGNISFLQAIILTLAVVTDWGFNISSVRDVSVNKGNPEKLGLIFSTVFWSKLFLLTVILLFYSIAVFFASDKELYLLALMLLVGKTFYPNWFFLGVEKNQYLVLGAVILNLCYGTLLFFFLNEKTDFTKVLFFQGTCMFFTSVILICVAATKYKFSIKAVGMSENVKKQLTENVKIFYSNASLTASSYFSTIVLKFFISDYLLGIYSLGQKIASVSKLGLTVFSASVYPRVSIAAQDRSGVSIHNIVKKIFLPYAIVFISGVVLCTFLIPYVIKYFDTNAQFEHFFFAEILFLVPIITLFNVMPYLILLAKKMERDYSKIMILSSVLSIVTLILWVPYFKIYGALASIIVVELYIVMALYSKAKLFLPKLY